MEREFYVEAEGETLHRGYVGRDGLLAEIERLFSVGAVKVSARLEPEQAEGSGAVGRARAKAETVPA